MSISKQLINGFVKSELDLFIGQFDYRFVPEIQDNRSIAIAWLCYFFKNVITKETSSAIIQFVDNVHSRQNYFTHGWIRISALQAAAFILTADINYAHSLIQHLDCGQSWARGFIIKSVGIICPLLSFQNQYLKEATENNLRYSHLFCEESVLLFLSTKGTADEKRKWLEQQIKSDEKAVHSPLFQRLRSADKSFKSGYFVHTFSEAKSYVIFKIFGHPNISRTQPELFDDTVLNYEDLIRIENQHPLNDYYIDLSFLK